MERGPKKELRLARPEADLVPSYLEAVAEMRAAGEKIWDVNVPFSAESDEAFVARLLRAETEPLPGLVPETTYWAVADGAVVGRISLRHFLNSHLEEFGGHIGYEVRPSSRRRGFATSMLGLVLKTERARKIGRLLLTCAPDNIASNKTIAANGGALTKTAFAASSQRLTNFYWIELPPGL